MFSFMKIVTFAALAFGAFASAMPTVESRAIEERQAATLTSILSGLPDDVQPHVDQLKSLNADTATPAKVTSIVLDITVVLDAAVASCKGLPVGAIGLGDILVLLSVVIQLIIIPCGAVYSLPGIDKGAIIGCFAPIGVSLVALITIVLDLVLGLLGGVLSVVIGLLVGLLGSSCTSIIVELKLDVLIKLLVL
ncbi:hypothetical protein OF83DRAFT_1174622 [Amylostereum chailletii]|nr:hypothetical protein OF83DRAFT_1174622 [Amylostereum chailletii]